MASFLDCCDLYKYVCSANLSPLYLRSIPKSKQCKRKSAFCKLKGFVGDLCSTNLYYYSWQLKNKCSFEFRTCFDFHFNVFFPFNLLVFLTRYGVYRGFAGDLSYFDGFGGNLVMSLFLIFIHQLEEIESMVTDPSFGSCLQLDWLYAVLGCHHILTKIFHLWAQHYALHLCNFHLLNKQTI